MRVRGWLKICLRGPYNFLNLGAPKGHNPTLNITIYYTLRFYFPYLSLLVQLVTIFVYGPVVYEPASTCIILDKKYNIANCSCHFRSYGSIWTGPSPKKYYMDISCASVHIILFGDGSVHTLPYDPQ